MKAWKTFAGTPAMAGSAFIGRDEVPEGQAQAQLHTDRRFGGRFELCGEAGLREEVHRHLQLRQDPRFRGGVALQVDGQELSDGATDLRHRADTEVQEVPTIGFEPASEVDVRL